MRYQAINPRLLKENRRRLAEALPPGGLAIVGANAPQWRSGDTHYPFRQNSNYFWLTGLTEPGGLLILFPSHPRPELRQLLLFAPKDQNQLLWQGLGLTNEQVSQQTGLDNVWTAAQPLVRIAPLISRAGKIFLDLPPQPNQHPAGHRLLEAVRQQLPLKPLGELRPILSRLRAVKSAEEIELIKTAIRITGEALAEVKGQIAGRNESELESSFGAAILRRGASGHAFNPIVAGGARACTIHYEANREDLVGGELVLLDVGAEFNNYPADVSRTWPVSGQMTKRQTEVYQAVRRVLAEVIKLMRPKMTLAKLEDATVKLIARELVALKLIKPNDRSDSATVRRFYPHAVSHHLGLDVHDEVDPDLPFAAGMVLTAEPGIYIPDEGLGVRLENDILITASEPVDLTADIPLES